MRRLRQHFVRIVGAWLLCQSFAMVAAPVSLCAYTSAGALEQVCTCAHEDGQECPMHHTTAKSRPSCSCGGTADSLAETLASMFSPIAILISETAAPAALTASGLWPAPEFMPLIAAFNPDPPPPRA
jgi:hypothetical protein